MKAFILISNVTWDVDAMSALQAYKSVLSLLILLLFVYLLDSYEMDGTNDAFVAVCIVFCLHRTIRQELCVLNRFGIYIIELEHYQYIVHFSSTLILFDPIYAEAEQDPPKISSLSLERTLDKDRDRTYVLVSTNSRSQGQGTGCSIILVQTLDYLP